MVRKKLDASAAGSFGSGGNGGSIDEDAGTEDSFPSPDSVDPQGSGGSMQGSGGAGGGGSGGSGGYGSGGTGGRDAGSGGNGTGGSGGTGGRDAGSGGSGGNGTGGSGGNQDAGAGDTAKDGGSGGGTGGRDAGSMGGTGGTDAGSVCHCPPCQRCGATGACEIDPASRWEIVCVGTSITLLAPDGSTWDRFREAGKDDEPTPDPFCEFETIAGQVDQATAGVTATLNNTLTPRWNQTVTPTGKTMRASDLMSTSAKWLLWVGDDDGCTARDGCTAESVCELKAPMQATWLKAGTTTIQSIGSCRSLNLKFVCKP